MAEQQGDRRVTEAGMKSLSQLVADIRSGEVGPGDRGAWSELVRELAPTVQAALRRFDVDAELRDDAAGETWRLLFERLDTVRDPERLHGWISVVASNQVISLLRRADRRSEVVVSDDVLEARGPVRNCDHLVEGEVRELLDRAVSRLSAREQTVIRCRALTDAPESLESIQLHHGIPAGSVGPTLGRGLQKLRRNPQLRRYLAEANLEHRLPVAS